MRRASSRTEPPRGQLGPADPFGTAGQNRREAAHHRTPRRCLPGAGRGGSQWRVAQSARCHDVTLPTIRRARTTRALAGAGASRRRVGVGLVDLAGLAGFAVDRGAQLAQAARRASRAAGRTSTNVTCIAAGPGEAERRPEESCPSRTQPSPSRGAAQTQTASRREGGGQGPGQATRRTAPRRRGADTTLRWAALEGRGDSRRQV